MIREKEIGLLCGLTLVIFGLTGCDNMQHQPSYRTYDPSKYFNDGASTRTPPSHTVSHEPLASEAFLTGRQNGQWIVELPIPITRQVLERGRERFDINCAVCHGEDGYGRGIVVRRGFPQPPSFHDPPLRSAAAGQLYEVITRGYGAMYPAGDRVTPSDRWAIVAYIRVLQLSQHAILADLTPVERAKLQTP